MSIAIYKDKKSKEVTPLMVYKQDTKKYYIPYIIKDGVLYNLLNSYNKARTLIGTMDRTKNCWSSFQYNDRYMYGKIPGNVTGGEIDYCSGNIDGLIDTYGLGIEQSTTLDNYNYGYSASGSNYSIIKDNYYQGCAYYSNAFNPDYWGIYPRFIPLDKFSNWSTIQDDNTKWYYMGELLVDLPKYIFSSYDASWSWGTTLNANSALSSEWKSDIMKTKFYFLNGFTGKIYPPAICFGVAIKGSDLTTAIGGKNYCAIGTNHSKHFMQKSPDAINHYNSNTNLFSWGGAAWYNSATRLFNSTYDTNYQSWRFQYQIKMNYFKSIVAWGKKLKAISYPHVGFYRAKPVTYTRSNYYIASGKARLITAYNNGGGYSNTGYVNINIDSPARNLAGSTIAGALSCLIAYSAVEQKLENNTIPKPRIRDMKCGFFEFTG